MKEFRLRTNAKSIRVSTRLTVRTMHAVKSPEGVGSRLSANSRTRIAVSEPDLLLRPRDSIRRLRCVRTRPMPLRPLKRNKHRKKQ